MKAEGVKRPHEQAHRLLAWWAADCAEHVLPYFEDQHPQDSRPRQAIEAARAWARGDIMCGASQENVNGNPANCPNACNRWVCPPEGYDNQ